MYKGDRIERREDKGYEYKFMNRIKIKKTDKDTDKRVQRRREGETNKQTNETTMNLGHEAVATRADKTRGHTGEGGEGSNRTLQRYSEGQR